MRVVEGWQGSDRNAASTNNTVRRFETETLAQEDSLQGLARMNTRWAEDAMAHTPHQRVMLDLDSSESPVHSQEEGAAYNGHFFVAEHGNVETQLDGTCFRPRPPNWAPRVSKNRSFPLGLS